jgi:hypothetical protein
VIANANHHQNWHKYDPHLIGKKIVYEITNLKWWEVFSVKLKMTGVVIFAALVAVLAIPTVALGELVRTPIQSEVTLQGNSGGSRSSQCGYIANQPNHQVEVTEDFTSLRFRVTSGGQPTLLIQSQGGQSECVMADGFSDGSIEIPGVWERGVYSVYVGDRGGNRHSYTLTIRQRN